MAEKNGIVIMEKPESISFQAVSEVLRKAHEKLRADGVYMRVPFLTPDELEQWVGEDGTCFVAMDGDKLVGTSALVIREFHRWYYKGKVPELTMQAVLPSHQGMHIFTDLNRVCEEAAAKSGYTAIYFDTAEANRHRIRLGKKEGFVLVDYFWHSDHYSVGMMKWMGKNPFSKPYFAIRFGIKKLYVKTRRITGK
ncbi:MAG: GNAT family N-acetyltransferase [Oscillospiraceae bacterium]|nr:GNAT family N-acetyltransferase [Oscillospiraceae bacterium]